MVSSQLLCSNGWGGGTAAESLGWLVDDDTGRGGVVAVEAPCRGVSVYGLGTRCHLSPTPPPPPTQFQAGLLVSERYDDVDGSSREPALCQAVGSSSRSVSIITEMRFYARRNSVAGSVLRVRRRGMIPSLSGFTESEATSRLTVDVALTDAVE